MARARKRRPRVGDRISCDQGHGVVVGEVDAGLNVQTHSGVWFRRTEELSKAPPPEAVTLQIIGRPSFEATVYSPFDGAEFVAQAPREGGPRSWLVTHRRTTILCAHRRTKHEALVLAGYLSDACPSAGLVELARDEAGAPIAGVTVGPEAQLRQEMRSQGVGQ